MLSKPLIGTFKIFPVWQSLSFTLLHVELGLATLRGLVLMRRGLDCGGALCHEIQRGPW